MSQLEKYKLDWLSNDLKKSLWGLFFGMMLFYCF